MTAALKQATQIKVQLRVVKGPHAGQTFNLNKSSFTIGRGPENDIVLMNDPLVSRTHAKIELSQGEFDLINLSQKNALMVLGENVTKWKLVNDSTFQVGDTELHFQFDSGKSVSLVQPAFQNVAHPSAPTPKSSPNLSLIKPQEKTNTSAVSTRVGNHSVVNKPNTNVGFNNQNVFKPQPAKPHVFAQTGFSQAQNQADQDQKNKKIRFYAIIAIAVLVIGYFFMGSDGKVRSKKQKPILKYEDELTYNLNSQTEKELTQKREEAKKEKQSPQVQRAEENFIKGMRDFQLGNYDRAQDFFQVVLNLVPDHELARRHLYLSKVRFDELVQVKLMLGESNYQKHNFDMCQSMYQQVMDMLQNKSTDPKYKTAQKMAEKCQLAAEGIR